MPDLSHVCDLYHSSRQRRILNPLSEARDGTRNLIIPSQIHLTTEPQRELLPKTLMVRSKLRLARISLCLSTHPHLLCFWTLTFLSVISPRTLLPQGLCINYLYPVFMRRLFLIMRYSASTPSRQSLSPTSSKVAPDSYSVTVPYFNFPNSLGGDFFLISIFR